MSSLFDRSASIDRATLRSPHPLDGTRHPRGPVPWGILTVLHVDYRIALQGASTLEDVLAGPATVRAPLPLLPDVLAGPATVRAPLPLLPDVLAGPAAVRAPLPLPPDDRLL